MIQLKTGDLILERTPFRPWNLVSYSSVLIRLFDKTFYNHVKVIVLNWDTPFCVEAKASGIKSINAEHDLQGKKIIVLRPKFIIQERDFAITANGFIGISKYNFWITYFKQAVYNIFGIWLSGSKDLSTERFNCSDFAAYLYHIKEWYKVSPRDLWKSEDFETVYKN